MWNVVIWKRGNLELTQVLTTIMKKIIKNFSFFATTAFASTGLLAAKSAICRSAFWGKAVNKALNFAGSAEPIIRAKASFTAAQSALEVTKPGLLMALSKALSWAATAAWTSFGSMVNPLSKTLSKAVATALGFLAETSEMYLSGGTADFCRNRGDWLPNHSVWKDLRYPQAVGCMGCYKYQVSSSRNYYVYINYVCVVHISFMCCMTWELKEALGSVTTHLFDISPYLTNTHKTPPFKTKNISIFHPSYLVICWVLPQSIFAANG